MNKKILTLLCTVCFLAGCSSSVNTNIEVKAADTFHMELISSDNYFNEYRDTETGVHYLVYSEHMYKGGAGGLCPRYNADGTLYVD